LNANRKSIDSIPHPKKRERFYIRASCSDVACAFPAVVPFMVAGKADNAYVGWVKAQVLPAPLCFDVVEVVDSRFADCDTA
jgi:hypothetical protein